MPKDSRSRRERTREAKRRARAAESDEARRARRAIDAARVAKKRAEETPEVRVERLARNAARSAYLRVRRARELERHMCTLEEETPAGDAVRHQEVHHTQLQQTCHDSHNPACYDDTDFFREELHGDYKQILSNTPSNQPEQVQNI
ncbi:uncharacterized protein LOC144517256 [Sander vitreus]